MTAQGTSESPPTAPAPGLPPQSPPERCPSPPLDDATTISPEALRHLLQPADENEVVVCLEEILLCVGMNELCDGDASRFRSDEWSQAVPPHGFDPTDKSTWHGSIWTPKRAASIEAAENLIYKGYPPSLILRVSFPEFENYPGFGDSLAYSIIADIDMREERRRLEQYQSFEDAVRLFKNSQRVLVLTGAGVSVSCGIPDFRSRDGIYSRLKVIYPELKDPSLMFDIHYFQLNPATFYNFAKDIFPGQFEPSLSHKFIRQLEKNGRLLRNYTQNIDTLERQAGIQRVVECHGSFSRVTCRDCKASFDGDVIKEDVMAQRVAKCPQCVEGILKPDIVFFGEDLSPYFHLQMAIDKEKPDLIVIIGSSLKVRPVALIPQAVPHQVPHIFINREKLAHYHPDIELLGDCDEIIRNICLALGGSYSTLLDEHEESMNARRAPDAPTYSLSRELRTFIDQESLKPVLDAVGIRSDSPPSLNGEPKAGSSAADGDDEATNDSDAPTKKRRRLDTEAREKSLYTHLHTLLPPNTYTIVNDNMSIFPGAEIYYDRETQSLCRPRGGNIADRDDSAEILEDLIDEEPDSSDLEEVEAEDEEEEGEEEGYQNGFLDFNSLPDNPEEDELDDPDDLGEP